jgi:dUTP pyrophosphatase
LKNSITVLNSPGTIDSDYRGEIGVILINHGEEKFEINRGMRIAQIVFLKLPEIEIIESKTLSQTDRGEGGFGSTGLK